MLQYGYLDNLATYNTKIMPNVIKIKPKNAKYF